jgi:hypothetical protein
MRSHIVIPSIKKFIPLVSLCVLLLSGCSFSLLNIPGLNSPTSTPPLPSGPTATPQPFAAVTFKATLPAPLPSGELLYLSVVDEVTGLGMHPTNYAMQSMDALHYTVNVPFAFNSVVSYRYVRQGNLPTLEDDPADKTVRYRMYLVTGTGMIEDVISSWADGPYSSPTGRISGQVLDSGNQSPLPNILIAAGGQQILTDSNGKFNLAALPTGTHNLVAYGIDGAYQTFQQGARVEAGKTTQVNLALSPASVVNVTFTLSVPANTLQTVPVRLAGNLYQLGNTFGDLQGGLSTVAARMPVLTPMPDGRYSITLPLPAGADLRYKYTLGDGFWNAEHSSDGAFVLRQLIVPTSQNSLQVQDTVQTWQAGASAPILFEVTVPSHTPVGDNVSIQFNPYGWTEPLPMWPRGNNRWVYQLYSPLNMLGDFEYRYCRNDQCGIADEISTSSGQHGRLVSTSLIQQDLQDTVTGWTWLQPGNQAALVGLPVTPRAAGFWAGVEFLPVANPTWQAWTPAAVQDVKSRHANWLVIAPTWSVSRTNPLVFSPVPGADALWNDNFSIVNNAHASNLDTALFPTANLPSDAAAWWKSAARDAGWWEAWFDRYDAFAAYHADLAAKSGAKALILGGEWVAPALPGGQVEAGSSGVPIDAAMRWESILADVRRRFKGQVLWAVSYPGGLQSVPAFVRSLDGVYLLWYAPLSGSTVEDMKGSAAKLLDDEIKPFQADLGKPVILAAAYPSVSGAAGVSLSPQVLFEPARAQGQVNLRAQADVYQALMLAVNERDWLGGFVSRGYYPPAALQDGSASVHGKPAEDVLWYWFGRFLGVAQ